MKTCSKCKLTKPYLEFYKHIRHRDGYAGICKVCTKIMVKEWYDKDPEKARKSARDRARRWGQRHKEVKTARFKEFKKSNPGLNAYHCAKRHATKLQRTPKWLTKDDMWIIREIYSLARLRTKVMKIEWQVDHIIPMKGQLVSGLHVPSNMQVILRDENVRKHNKYEV